MDPLQLLKELNEEIDREYLKEPYKAVFTGSLDNLLRIQEDLEKNNESKLISVDKETGDTTIFNIIKLKEKTDNPKVTIKRDLIFFNVENLLVTVPSDQFFEFISEVKEKLENKDPHLLRFSLGLKNNFVTIVAEIPYSHMENGKLINATKEINAVLRDYFYVVKKLSDYSMKGMKSGKYKNGKPKPKPKR